MGSFNLKIKPKRPTRIAANNQHVLATYTLDQAYITPLELLGKKTPETHKVLPRGWVVALHPTTQKIVPHYTSYGFAPVGVILIDADCGSGDYERDTEIEVLFRGDVMEENTWDNGIFGEVLSITKDTLANRIQFVKETGLIRF